MPAKQDSKVLDSLAQRLAERVISRKDRLEYYERLAALFGLPPYPGNGKTEEEHQLTLKLDDVLTTS